MADKIIKGLSFVAKMTEFIVVKMTEFAIQKMVEFTVVKWLNETGNG
jgi:hypothetical protein